MAEKITVLPRLCIVVYWNSLRNRRELQPIKSDKQDIFREEVNDGSKLLSSIVVYREFYRVQTSGDGSTGIEDREELVEESQAVV